MKRQDLLTILITFGMGLVFGFYMYVVGFAPASQQVSTMISASGEELTVTGEAYGGCQRSGTCPSFNIAADGSYRFFVTPTGSTVAEVREGVLPLALQRQLSDHLTDTALVRQSQPIEAEFCESFVDGLDARFRVTLEGNTYTVDSCTTAIEVESALWQALNNIWVYLERAS